VPGPVPRSKTLSLSLTSARSASLSAIVSTDLFAPNSCRRIRILPAIPIQAKANLTKIERAKNKGITAISKQIAKGMTKCLLIDRRENP
jgi:hypothetical protein